MIAKDGKKRQTDVADTEQVLRIIQSIPSPKAEPFKLWLAEVGKERIEETIDPELTIDRALETYLNYHFSEEIGEEDIAFSYKILEGPATSQNAVKLLEFAGFPEEIIEAAQEV